MREGIHFCIPLDPPVCLPASLLPCLPPCLPQAYARRGRAMVAPDVLEEVGAAFQELVNGEEQKAAAD